MKKQMKAIALRVLAVTFGMGMLFSCTVDPDSPGLEYMPDMYRSPAIEPYVDYGWVKEQTLTEYAHNISALHPPAGSIPFYGDIEDLEIYLPYQRQANSFASKTHGLLLEHGWNLSTEPGGDYFKSAEDKNPIQLTAENEEVIFKKGKELYDINCAHCHSKTGDGKGPMVESGAYMGVPDYNNLQALADGQVFFSIYYGKGMMGAHAQLLDNYEIWTLVHYVNKLRFEDYDASYNQGKNEADSDTEDDSNDDTAEVDNENTEDN